MWKKSKWNRSEKSELMIKIICPKCKKLFHQREVIPVYLDSEELQTAATPSVCPYCLTSLWVSHNKGKLIKVAVAKKNFRTCPIGNTVYVLGCGT